MNGWLRRLFHKRLMEKRLDAELRFHLEQKVRDYVASGLSPEEARRRANLALGGLEQVKQDCREARLENHVEDFLHDFQYVFSTLTKDRRFALVAVFALALGIGATTVMFSVLYSVVVHPFPYRDFRRSVILEMWDLTGPREGEARFHYTIATEKARAVSWAATSPRTASSLMAFPRCSAGILLRVTASPARHLCS